MSNNERGCDSVAGRRDSDSRIGESDEREEREGRAAPEMESSSAAEAASELPARSIPICYTEVSEPAPDRDETDAGSESAERAEESLGPVPVDDYGEITNLILAYARKEPGAEDELFAAIYDDLSRLAANQLARPNPCNLLCPAGLVNEAYMRLTEQRFANVRDRRHFFRIAAQVMRRVLCDKARAHLAEKRGGTARQLPPSALLHVSVADPVGHEIDILALEEALIALERVHPLGARVVELRFFGGLGIRDTSEAIGISAFSVTERWNAAKRWLLKYLDGPA